MLLTEFLSLVLPSEGVKCWVSIHDKRVSQGFAADTNELAKVLQGIDTQRWDAYFACASYKETGSRKRENALCAKSFWIDIDAGEGKPYATADAAIAALETFIERIGSPLPIVVRSGNGIHAYWVLDCALPADEWVKCASAFKSLMAVHNLHADPSRTSDIASILRVPGTHNWKNPAEPKAVYVEYEDYDITPAEFFRNLSRVAGPVPLHSSPTSILAGLAGAPKAMPPSMVEGIIDGNGRTEGMMKRIGWCFGPGKMNYEQTVESVTKWNQLNVPPIDAHKILNAVNNIYSREASKPVEITPEIISPVSKTILNDMPDAPRPYRWGAQGQLMQDSETEDGAYKAITISEYPIYLADVCCRENELSISYVFKTYHPHRGWTEFFIPASEFMGQGCHGALAERGADITDVKKFKHAVHIWAVRFKGERMDSYRYSQFGWKEDGSFLLCDKLHYAGGKVKRAYGDEKLAPRMEYMRPAVNGSLQAWSAAANRLYALGMEAYGFVLLASFAAPLMEFCIGESEGGAVISMHSGKSGRGKTRTLEAVASVWGKFDALATVGSDTHNARFGIITLLRNLPVLYEELTEMDPMLLRKLLKDFTSGREKNRAQRDGSVQLKENRFKTIMISASNNSVLDTVRQSHDEGAVARVFEISMQIPDSREFAPDRFQQTLDIMKANRGYAGARFIEVLLVPGMIDKVRDMLDKAKLHFQTVLKTEPEDRFIAHMLATILVAAKIVTDQNILDFDIKRIMEWGTSRAKERVAVAAKENPVQALALFIDAHMFECLTVSGPAKNRNTPVHVITPPQRGLKMRNEKETNRMYISIDAINQWATKRHISITDVVKALTDKQILLNRNRLTTLTAGTDYPAVRLPCWEIDTSHPEVSGSIRLIPPVSNSHEIESALS